MSFEHRPVLLVPTVAALVDPSFGRSTAVRNIAMVLSDNNQRQGDRANGIFVDGTFGRGGHSRALLDQLGPNAQLVVFDKDPQAIDAANILAGIDPRVRVVHDGFAKLADALDSLGIGHIDGAMFDLGVSSPQLDDAQRGFSFMRDGPLDMRMDTTRGLTVAQWLAQASVDDMREVIASYGEERFAFQIARKIAAYRVERPIETTLELAELVAGTVRTRERGQHPATRTFQALRIYINQEIEELALALAATVERLAPQGRMAVISFHSIEDRMVKQYIASAARPGAVLARLPLRECEMPQPILCSLGRIRANDQEVAGNARSRSAVLRVAERTETPLGASGTDRLVNTILRPSQPALLTSHHGKPANRRMKGRRLRWAV